jgi:ABC-type multidrug transport system fused ATPase/permease subunit
MMNLAEILSNEYFTTFVKIVLILYASQIAPNAPSYMVNLFKNTFVKIALIFLMVFMANNDFQFSLIFAVIFVLGINVISGRQILESYTNMDMDTMINNQEAHSKNYKKFGNLTLIESQNEIYPGCKNIKLKDLLEMFDNDHYKLQNAVQSSFKQLLSHSSYTTMKNKERLEKIAIAAGLPYNLEINDENAPWIATLLINYGFIVDKTCQPPN